MTAHDRSPIIPAYRFRLSGCQRYPKDDCKALKDSVLPFIASASDIVAAEIIGAHLDLEDIDVNAPYRLEISQHVYGPERYSWGASLSDDRDNNLWKAILGKDLPHTPVHAELEPAARLIGEWRRAPQAIATYRVRLADLSNHQRIALAALRRSSITEAV